MQADSESSPPTEERFDELFRAARVLLKLDAEDSGSFCISLPPLRAFINKVGRDCYRLRNVVSARGTMTFLTCLIIHHLLSSSHFVTTRRCSR